MQRSREFFMRTSAQIWKFLIRVAHISEEKPCDMHLQATGLSLRKPKIYLRLEPFDRSKSASRNFRKWRSLANA
jgi:hypothetical protein